MSTLEQTWDSKEKMHICCGSKHSYHKPHCRFRQLPPEADRSKDPIFIIVQRLRAEGFTSEEVAKIMVLPLAEINQIYAA